MLHVLSYGLDANSLGSRQLYFIKGCAEIEE